MSDSEEPIDAIDDGGDDLFGDDDGDQLLSEVESPKSDREVASDRDEEEQRERHEYGGEEEPVEYSEKRTQDVPLYRHPIPKSRDGGLISLKVPNFMKLNPAEYKPDTWEPSSWDLKNANADHSKPSVLFRRDPQTGKMRSNTNIYRWSDGSVTVAVGDEHYEILTKSLAPPPGKPYKEVADTHYYAAAAHLTTNSLLVIGHFTEQYNVRSNQKTDLAEERLAAAMEKMKKERERDMMISTIEDPELKRKQAEQAEKELMRAQRRRENAAARADGGPGSRYKSGGLSIGDLEGRRGASAGGRKRGAPGGGKKKHRPEYDSDDDLPSGARRPDNYDMEDDFIVDSNDESEIVDDDEEEEEILDDDEEEAPRSKRQKTAPSAQKGEDADGEPDEDDDVDAPATSSRRRRRIVDDDDEEY